MQPWLGQNTSFACILTVGSSIKSWANIFKHIYINSQRQYTVKKWWVYYLAFLLYAKYNRVLFYSMACIGIFNCSSSLSLNVHGFYGGACVNSWVPWIPFVSTLLASILIFEMDNWITRLVSIKEKYFPHLTGQHLHKL